MMHNKMLIVDKLMVSVGSTNFDVRSFRLNDEASLNIYNSAFASRMTEVFEGDMKPTVRYTYQMWNERLRCGTNARSRKNCSRNSCCRSSLSCKSLPATLINQAASHEHSPASSSPFVTSSPVHQPVGGERERHRARHARAPRHR